MRRASGGGILALACAAALLSGAAPDRIGAATSHGTGPVVPQRRRGREPRRRRRGQARGAGSWPDAGGLRRVGRWSAEARRHGRIRRSRDSARLAPPANRRRGHQHERGRRSRPALRVYRGPEHARSGKRAACQHRDHTVLFPPDVFGSDGVDAAARRPEHLVHLGARSGATGTPEGHRHEPSVERLGIWEPGGRARHHEPQHDCPAQCRRARMRIRLRGQRIRSAAHSVAGCIVARGIATGAAVGRWDAGRRDRRFVTVTGPCPGASVACAARSHGEWGLRRRLLYTRDPDAGRKHVAIGPHDVDDEHLRAATGALPACPGARRQDRHPDLRRLANGRARRDVDAEHGRLRSGCSPRLHLHHLRACARLFRRPQVDDLDSARGQLSPFRPARDPGCHDRRRIVSGGGQRRRGVRTTRARALGVLSHRHREGSRRRGWQRPAHEGPGHAAWRNGTRARGIRRTHVRGS